MQIAQLVEEKGMIEPFLSESVRLYGTSAGPTHHGYDARLGNVFKSFRSPIRKYRTSCTTTRKLRESIYNEIPFKVYDAVGDKFFEDQLNSYMRDIIIPGETILTDNDFIIDEIEDGDGFILHPHTGVLACTMEYFRMPKDVCGHVWGKSTLARLFVHQLCTPLEAGWHGQLVIEVVNFGERAVLLRPGMGFIQVQFEAADEPAVSYGDKGGLYQGQVGVQQSKW